MIALDISARPMSQQCPDHNGAKGNTNMYFILLLKLDCSVSGWYLNKNMTMAQLKLANTGHALFCIRALVSALHVCEMKVGNGVLAVALDGSIMILAKLNMTRANTYITICWLTESCLPRPKTTYPPVNPAKKLS